MKWLILAAAIICNALANILIKAGMTGANPQLSIFNLLKERCFSPSILAGIACFVLALVAYSYVLSRMNLSVAYPIMTGAGFLIIGIVSALVFKESLKLLQIVGFALICLGILFASR